MLFTNAGQARRLALFAFAAFVSGTGANSARAASPADLAAGRALFEKQWVATNPTIQSDGLGPLFNGNSCVACHHQGGVGGSGDARFNARTIGLEEIWIVPRPTQDQIARLVGSFHPGFLAGSNRVVSAIPLHHHGGTGLFAQNRSGLLSQLASRSDAAGGPLDAAEVRQEIATPLHYQQTLAKHRMKLRARIFHRNTTALFGAGLIDAVPIEALEEQTRLQKRHPEISGRPATLDNGLTGKFGWRANVATLRKFNDQACANELGLKTRTHEQPADATAPEYHNPRYDIDDDQVEAMHQFVAALPAPVRAFPQSPAQQQLVQQGEQLFASIGCAICHTPSLGPAQGLYSDLLLHDMGYELRDLSAADPYVIRSKVIQQSIPRQILKPGFVEQYYGSPAFVGEGNESAMQSAGNIRLGPGMRQSSPPSPRSAGSRVGYHFVAPTYPTNTLRMTSLAYKRGPTPEPPAGEITADTNPYMTTTDTHLYVRQTIEPTAVTQEWRTAPLWGLRDSAPYMHDGRAGTVLEAIALHEGEASGTRDRFLNLSIDQRDAILAFLDTLVAPPNAPQPLQNAF